MFLKGSSGEQVPVQGSQDLYFEMVQDRTAVKEKG